MSINILRGKIAADHYDGYDNIEHIIKLDGSEATGFTDGTTIKNKDGELIPATRPTARTFPMLEEIRDFNGDVVAEQTDSILTAIKNLALVAGKKGDKGDNGLNGKDGANGIDGIDGRDGTNGKDGADGIDGLNGTDGANGKDGSMYPYTFTYRHDNVAVRTGEFTMYQMYDKTFVSFAEVTDNMLEVDDHSKCPLRTTSVGDIICLVATKPKEAGAENPFTFALELVVSELYGGLVFVYSDKNVWGITNSDLSQMDGVSFSLTVNKAKRNIANLFGSGFEFDLNALNYSDKEVVSYYRDSAGTVTIANKTENMITWYSDAGNGNMQPDTTLSVVGSKIEFVAKHYVENDIKKGTWILISNGALL